jgi:periplasmic divalent cation tolerance protein
VRVVLVTAPDMATAEALVETLVEERLIACGNVVSGVVSIFRWEGTVQRENEAMLLLKSTSEQAGALTERILELHPYDLPEVLVIPVETGNPAYLEWVAANVGGES